MPTSVVVDLTWYPTDLVSEEGRQSFQLLREDGTAPLGYEGHTHTQYTLAEEVQFCDVSERRTQILRIECFMQRIYRMYCKATTFVLVVIWIGGGGYLVGVGVQTAAKGKPRSVLIFVWA